MSDPLLIACSGCGATNRVPPEKLKVGLEPVCGRCKQALSIDQPFAVTDDTFADLVERSELPVLVDMWAQWCGPCRMISPMIDELAKEMRGQARFAKLNVDENPRTATRFQIQSIPALLVMKGGREVDRIVGARPKAEIAKRLLHAIA